MRTTVRGWAAEKDQFLNGIARRRHHSQVRNSPWTTFLCGVESTKKFSVAPLGSKMARPVSDATGGAPIQARFFRSALDSCERLMVIPSRASISAGIRAIVQFGRLATGSSSSGATTRKAVSLFTGNKTWRHAGLQRVGATAAEIAAPQPYRVFAHAERLGDPRTGPPRSVSRMARALSASPRSREPARAAKAERWSSLAETGDLPLMPHLLQIDAGSESYTYPLVKLAESA